MIRKARLLLIRFAKMFPFILCVLVCISYLESLSSLLLERYSIMEDSVCLYKPISWSIGTLYVYEWRAILVATVLSIAFETCLWNKLGIVYLVINLFEKYVFFRIELYEYVITMICIVNIIISSFLVFKGVKILPKH